MYFTRDEDNFQADNILAENFTLAVNQAAQEGGDREPARRRAASRGTACCWSQPDTPRDAISERLGFEWTGIDTVDGGDLLIFLRDGKVVRFADYRGTGSFEGFERPFDELPDDARRGRRTGNFTGMSALSQLDLSLKLSKQEEAEQLAAAQERLLTLRLQLGGQTADELGPPLCVLFEGWDASGKGGAIKRLVDHARPAPRARRRSSPRRRRTRSATSTCGASGRRCRAGAAWPSSTARGTGACSSSASRASPPRPSGSAPTARSTTSSARSCDDGMILVKFWLHVSDEEQLKRFEAREKDPLKSWKLTDEDWRNREKRADVRGRDRGDGRAHRSTECAPWTLVAARLQALRARQGARDGDRRDRGEALRVSAARWAFARLLLGARLGPHFFLAAAVCGLRAPVPASGTAGPAATISRGLAAGVAQISPPMMPKPTISAPPMMNSVLRPVSPSSVVVGARGRASASAPPVAAGRRLPTVHPPGRRGRGRAVW